MRHIPLMTYPDKGKYFPLSFPLRPPADHPRYPLYIDRWAQIAQESSRLRNGGMGGESPRVQVQPLSGFAVCRMTAAPIF